MACAQLQHALSAFHQILVATLTIHNSVLCFLNVVRDVKMQLQANRGEINLTKAFEERLANLNFSPTDIDRFLEQHPPHTRLVPVSVPCAAC